MKTFFLFFLFFVNWVSDVDGFRFYLCEQFGVLGKNNPICSFLYVAFLVTDLL